MAGKLNFKSASQVTVIRELELCAQSCLSRLMGQAVTHSNVKPTGRAKPTGLSLTNFEVECRTARVLAFVLGCLVQMFHKLASKAASVLYMGGQICRLGTMRTSLP
jgi:hypothetical protein